MTAPDSPVNQLQHLIDTWPDTLDWSVTPYCCQLCRLYQGILDGNQRLNLTRIIDPQDFLEKHLWDSLAGILLSPVCRSVTQVSLIDIGTGGGFPGLPVAMIYPHWSVMLMDSTRKKIKFLNGLGQQLGLENIHCVTGRAETLGQASTHRERYQLATLRAVGSAALCAEYGLPFLQLGGTLVLYRGQWQPSDAAELTAACELLGGKVTTVIPHETPWTHSQRHYVYVQKINPTPADYPRANGIPKQSPLGSE